MMAAQWKLMTDRIPLDSLNKYIPGTSWRYDLVLPFEEDTGGHDPQRRSGFAKLLGWLYTRALWRFVLVLTALLLFLNLFKSNVKTHLGRSTGRVHTAWLDSGIPDDIDWSQYAYCQYVTNAAYLCNSLMIFESLQRLGSKASRVIMYPRSWAVEGTSKEGRLLMKARDEYGVALQPVEIQHFSGESTWADSFTKLLAFNQTAYKRVLSLDSDATVLQPMDELFLLPSAPVAMPRAYWLEDKPNFLSSQLVLVEPSTFEMDRVVRAFEHRSSTDFDMEIVNDLYGKDCIIVPHRRYDLLSGEFRKTEHYLYLGSKEELWDPERAYDEAKFLHFSDWPLPKPWIQSSENQKNEIAPRCKASSDGGPEDCRDKEKWLFIYQDFGDRRERVCGSDFIHKRSSLQQVAQRRWFEPGFEP